MSFCALCTRESLIVTRTEDLVEKQRHALARASDDHTSRDTSGDTKSSDVRAPRDKKRLCLCTACSCSGAEYEFPLQRDMPAQGASRLLAHRERLRSRGVEDAALPGLGLVRWRLRRAVAEAHPSGHKDERRLRSGGRLRRPSGLEAPAPRPRRPQAT